MAYIGFISLGLPDTLIGVAWPSVRDHFHLQQSAIAYIFFGAGCSYFLSSFFTGRLLQVFGIGMLLATSSALVALSGFGFGLAPLWMLFAACSLLHGLGSGAIDAGLNHYVAHHFSAKHMNWLHACYALGATLGPLIMTGVIAWHRSWRVGYLTVATILFSLALLFTVTRRKWNEPGQENKSEGDKQEAPPAGMADTLRHPTVWLQVILFFIYTGLEVTVGQWSFTVLTESRGVQKETAGLWVTIYWGSIAVGRVLLGFVVDRLGIDKLIRLSLLTALAGTTLFALKLSPATSGLALALAGLGLASIFPCMMTRTPQRLGKALAAHAIGFQVSAAMLGAASLPSLSGLFAQRLGLNSVTTATVVMAAALFLLHESVLVRDRQRFVLKVGCQREQSGS
jgi:fucose permease